MMDAEKQSSDSQAMSDLPKRLRIKASMIALGERIAWGSDTAIMEEAAEVIEALSAAAQSTPAAQVAVPDGFMPIPTAEQLAEALDNVRSFHDMSAELIAPELLTNLLAALAASTGQEVES